MINWLKDQCPVCGRAYEYPENGQYKPKTCSTFECVQKYAHNSDYYENQRNQWNLFKERAE